MPGAGVLVGGHAGHAGPHPCPAPQLGPADPPAGRGGAGGILQRAGCHCVRQVPPARLSRQHPHGTGRPRAGTRQAGCKEVGVSGARSHGARQPPRGSWGHACSPSPTHDPRPRKTRKPETGTQRPAWACLPRQGPWVLPRPEAGLVLPVGKGLGDQWPLFLSGPPGDCCETSNCFMAEAQSSAPRRGQLLMRTLMQRARAGEGPGGLRGRVPRQERAQGAGGLDARPQLQLVCLWRLPNPSQQVGRTWAEGFRGLQGGQAGPGVWTPSAGGPPRWLCGRRLPC